MRRPLLALALLAIAVASCGGSDEGAPTPTPTNHELPPHDELVDMYAYDTSEPLETRELAVESYEGATAHDIEYQSSGYAVPAWLVLPEGKGPFPAVLYAHGLTLNRSYFLPDAVALAQRGYAGLLIDYPAGREPYAEFTSFDAEADIAGNVQYVIDLRRGLDLLESLPEIDGERIGYVCHSQGGIVGGILAGIEGRIDAYVITSAGGSYADVVPNINFAGSPPPEDAELSEYQADVAVIDPVNYVVHNDDAAFLFQGSQTDAYFTVANQEAFAEAAGEQVQWYEGGHALGCTTHSYCDAALPSFIDHRAWLEENV